MGESETFGIAFLAVVGIILIITTSHWIIGLLHISWAIAVFLGSIQDERNEYLDP